MKWLDKWYGVHVGTKKDPLSLTGCAAVGGTTTGCPGSPPEVAKDPCKQYACPKCGRSYMWKNTLMRHLRNECGKEPQFQCPFCPHRTKLKSNLTQHIRYKHMPPPS
ncbi:Longitudinals lacking protein, isoform G [Frankliniella fusca]|uniref:Longitudinals lacking protein, isoform G n=1 Tax=Frankliniella fusca TaxID=407009 RepID=A0AAE1LE61_9NEOP|nr:Longitudinals lacking protein, isoform G [Frankliniella fusca]